MKINIKTLIALFFCFGVLLSCGRQSPEEKLKKDTDDLLKEVIALHDLSMAKMDELMSLSRSLKSQIDSTNQVDFQEAIDQLDASHQAMMDWMRNFSTFFSGAQLAGGHTAHHDGNVTTEATLAELQSTYDRLLAEKAGIANVDKEMDEHIARARQLLVNTASGQ